MKHLKCVVLGDGAVGKTSLLMSFTSNSFPGDYIPTVFDNYCANIFVDSQMVHLQLWDTTGEEDLANLRTCMFDDTDVFITVFSLVNPASLDSVVTRWVPEIFKHYESVPILIVGTKSDLRDSFQENFVQYCQKGMAPLDHTRISQKTKNLKINRLIECSAKDHSSIRAVFEHMTKIGLCSRYHTYEVDDNHRQCLVS